VDIFKSIFALNGERVKYMLAGGFAVNLYGVERAENLNDGKMKKLRDKLKAGGVIGQIAEEAYIRCFRK
jgi:hypothetical protein